MSTVLTSWGTPDGQSRLPEVPLAVRRLPGAIVGGDVSTQVPVKLDERTGRARVLVADDHQALLQRIVALLASEFTVVGTVTDGQQLVDAEAALCPDVIVVDISMPGLNGLEASALIRCRGSRATIVYLTAHDEWDIIEAAWAAGGLGYVIKAAIARDLVPAVHAALEGRRFVSQIATASRPRVAPPIPL
jgi:DNA-binding NarL/FixJ family response regulator